MHQRHTNTRYYYYYYYYIYPLSEWQPYCSGTSFFEVPLMCEAACVSGDVASQMRHFPARHGVKVTPSGLLIIIIYLSSNIIILLSQKTV